MSLITELTTTGYSSLKNCGIAAHAVVELMDLFYYFIENPLTEPSMFICPAQPLNNGFTIKNGAQNTDIKILFHYRPQLVMQLAAHNPLLLRNERLRRLLSLCEYISSASSMLLMRWLHLLQRELPGEPPLAQAVRGNHCNVLRLVAYTGYRPAAPPQTLTCDHTDRALGTLALYESHPGFEACSPNKNIWLPLAPTPDQPVAFAGQQLTALTNNLVPALCHRSRHLCPAARVNPRIIRGAVVFFGYARSEEIKIR